ncbi:hypothetical protein XO08_07700 [Thermosipho sp. 1074]|nr:hypothetical protein XO08_07700 [Thermosipho sp. 1074]
MSLRELRQQLGLSQSELANLVNVSVMHINHIENGRRLPSLFIAFKLARVLSELSGQKIYIEDLFQVDDNTEEG